MVAGENSQKTIRILSISEISRLDTSRACLVTVAPSKSLQDKYERYKSRILRIQGEYGVEALMSGHKPKNKPLLNQNSDNPLGGLYGMAALLGVIGTDFPSELPEELPSANISYSIIYDEYNKTYRVNLLEDQDNPINQWVSLVSKLEDLNKGLDEVLGSSNDNNQVNRGSSIHENNPEDSLEGEHPINAGTSEKYSPDRTELAEDKNNHEDDGDIRHQEDNSSIERQLSQQQEPANGSLPAGANGKSEETSGFNEVFNNSEYWSSDWGTDITAALSKSPCKDPMLIKEGFTYKAYSSIPKSRLASHQHAWFVFDDRAVTVLGCWRIIDGAKSQYKMMRKKDNKIFEDNVDLSDGTWTPSYVNE